jgi:hypothetical protein
MSRAESGAGGEPSVGQTGQVGVRPSAVSTSRDASLRDEPSDDPRRVQPMQSLWRGQANRLNSYADWRRRLGKKNSRQGTSAPTLAAVWAGPLELFGALRHQPTLNGLTIARSSSRPSRRSTNSAATATTIKRINLGGLVWTATVIYCRTHGGFEEQA